MSPLIQKRLSLFLGLALALCPVSIRAEETILQYFNTSWQEIEQRIPEVAEAGYTSLWLPPPFKGASGTYSVGFDTFDRFDLGDIDQSGTIRTKYGTKADLLSLIRVAHRFGIKVYFDNVMAHNGGPLGDTPPGTLLPENMPGYRAPRIRSSLPAPSAPCPISTTIIDPALTSILTAINCNASGGHNFCLQTIPILTGHLSDNNSRTMKYSFSV